MSKYRHLFFDLDNTLYDFSSNSFIAMKEAFNQLGILSQLPSFDEYFDVYIQINNDLWAEYREQKITKDLLRAARFERSLNAFKVTPVIAYTEIDDLYLKIMSEQTTLFPGTLEVLTELKIRGYQIHIITNGFKEVQHHKLRNTGLEKFVTNVFISEEIKSHKPSKEIFEHAIKSSNARKKESLMVGDSWESDIIGAKNFGIDQIFFNLENIEIDYGSYGEPTYTIFQLNQLLSIL